MNLKKAKAIRVRVFNRTMKAGIPWEKYQNKVRHVKRHIPRLNPETGDLELVEATEIKYQRVLDPNCGKGMYRELKKMAEKAGF